MAKLEVWNVVPPPSILVGGVGLSWRLGNARFYKSTRRWRQLLTQVAENPKKLIRNLARSVSVSLSQPPGCG